MRSRLTFWILLCLLLAAGAWLFCRQAIHRASENSSGATANSATISKSLLAGNVATNILKSAASAKTNRFAYRLSNTTKTIGALVRDTRAILLENALIDTRAKLNLAIPKNLQAKGDPGAYIVQANGSIDNSFRAMLAQSGAQIVSYIPNDAYLVTATAGAAAQIAASGFSVIPYEPYYKVPSSLLAEISENVPQVINELKVAAYPNTANQLAVALPKMGFEIAAEEPSPFGEVFTVRNVSDVAALAQMPAVQRVEPVYRRVHANDLSRPILGVAADSVTPTNYMNLYGSNVIVAVNDSGIDATHPDFSNDHTTPLRVFGATNDLVDANGHGTFVAGEIAGDGFESTTVTNASGSINPGTNGQYRGKAPLAKLFSMNLDGSDSNLQASAVLTNALISNNSWYYIGDNAYDLAAASYDAATRDALPTVTGSQPVLFVFSAGNEGNGDDSSDPGGGDADTIDSPATAKNVISVGAIQELRNITNQVTNADGTVSTPWKDETSTSYRVAGFSSRGNVGIGTEGTFGRYKPDVVAPGTFTVSTRSSQWDIADYFYQDPTNYDVQEFDDIIVQPDSAFVNSFPVVPDNAVQVTINVFANADSPNPFPDLPIFVGLESSAGYDFVTTNDAVSIPPDGVPDGPTYLAAIESSESFVGFNYAVSNNTTEPISFDLTTDIITTNGVGNYFIVLSNLDQSIGTPNPNSTGPGPYYRYETGTSMSAADISGVLALMQDYFINDTAETNPSPALLKAMLINGARATGFYDFDVQNAITWEGWGLANLANSVPSGITNQFGMGCTSFFVDQSPTNALATGDSHTFNVTVSTNATALPLRVTLAWTDPPGNPAAAIKLVNNLDLVVTNLDDPTNVIVYCGNDIPASSVYNEGLNGGALTNALPLDSINNVENVFLPPGAGTNFSVTVIGRGVNVNAVTAQTNNVVQDYALVISYGEGEVTNGITVTDGGIVSNPTGDQDITLVITNNAPLMNQFAGANTPLLGTNTVDLGGTNEIVTLGMTNQWHFYVVTNYYTNFANAAFITFLSDTLAIPRMGAYADSAADATQPEGDVDLYVSTDPTLTNLNPMVISNCVNGTQVGASIAGAPPIFNGASLSRGGTEFVADTNSTQGQVYYVGVKSEDQEAAEFGFIPVFSASPFSQTDANGNEYVQGVPLPVNIPDGSPKHPGSGYIFGLALQSVEVGRVIVTNTIVHENFGDLIGVLNHGATSDVLNNHDSLPNPPGPYTLIYDDSGRGDIAGAQPSDGPGSLNSFQSQEGIGPWILTETDDSLTQTGSVTGFNMFIEKHQDPTKGITVSIPPGTWFYTFVDVPTGYTNLTVAATNLPPTVTPPLQLYLNYGTQPDFSNYLESTELTNGIIPGNSLSYGPPLQSGTYYIGIYNPSSTTANAYLIATLNGSAAAISPSDYTTNNGPFLLDDAANSSTIFVSATQQIASVNVGMVVNHPRISDLTFTLVSPTGQRILLMENRGGSTTNGAGYVFYTTNYFAPVTSSGSYEPNTNYINVNEISGLLTITYNFYTAPDEMTVYYGTNISPNALILDTGLTNNPSLGAGAQNTQPETITLPFGPTNGIISTYLTIVMNQFGNPASTNGNGSDAWTYTAGGVQTNFNYLTFTEDTNLTTTPIKFAVPPFNLTDMGTNYILSDFELATNGDYLAPTNIFDAFGGWSLTNQMLVGTNLVNVTNNEVSVVTDPANAADGSNFLALANGVIFRQITMTPGKQFSLTYQYRGPGISAWWRGEGDATDSSDAEGDGNNGLLIGRFNFPAGEVGQSFEMEDAGNEFQFAGTNTYVQIRQSPSLDVGAGSGLTVEGWISPTNVSFQQPLVEWLAQMPTNGSDTNLVIAAGPFLDPATGHYYYMLASTNWTTSEFWATQLGGHLATVDTANEENWIYDTFGSYAGTNRGALWIGLNDASNAPLTFTYSSGLTNISYTNWASAQPDECTGNEHYVAIVTATNDLSGLWVVANNNGVSCTTPATNTAYGVVEVDDIQPNGVQFWISVTNAPGTTNQVATNSGCLYANLVDTTNGSHIIYSAPGLVQSNVFQHVALTYNTNSGLAALYFNGTNVVSTNLGVFTPKTGGDVLLGKDMSRATNGFYGGEMDEMSIYARALSASEIAAIYQVSAATTNRNIGKFDPSITPPLSLAEARVSLGGLTNVIMGMNDSWQSQGFTFTATTNSLPMQITGLEPGILLDSFSVAEAPLGNLYYQPEQTLDTLDNTSANGTWTLEILDDRTGAYITNSDQLISWQLQFVLASNSPAPIALSPQESSTASVPPGQTVYFSVAAPSWANFATNILVSSDMPVDLLFNQTNPPTGSNPGDYTLLAGQTSGIGNPVLSANPPSTPPLLPGQTYYLGVRNNGTHAASVVVEVDFDITTLTNGVPLSSVLNTNDAERYFAFNVSSNAYEVTFQLLKLSSNADLVVSKGAPLPTLVSADYGSFNSTNADENIYVLTNSAPVPLSPRLWYLGVIKRDAGPVNYTVLAKELDTSQPTIIDLTNDVPFNFTAGPGAALTNFFRFTVTNSPAGVKFELYNLTGNGDLTVQTNAPPLQPPFFQSSQQPGLDSELIYIQTNSSLSGLTNSPLTNLDAQWYLGVPDNETTQINFTILAEIITNNVFPAFPGAEGAGAGAIGGRFGDVYHVINLNDSGAGSLRAAVNSTTNSRTVVFDISGTINLSSPLVITNSFLTIAGQTAPGGGITVAGNMTTLTNAHDVIIRDVRFRRGAVDDSLQLTNVSNVIADHISAEWTSDNNISVLNSSNVTVQWSILADSLYLTNNPQGVGSLLRYANGALSFSHNLYADNYNGSPRLGDNLKLDFVNNVIYNWGTNAGFSVNENIVDDPSGFTNELNYIGNYLIAGSNSVMTNIAFWSGTTNTWIFQTNNFIDGNKNGILDGANTGWNMFTNKFTETNQFPPLAVSIDEAFVAYERVLDFAGPDMAQRDSVDTNIVSKVRLQTGTLISTPPLSGMVAWWKAESNILDSVGTNNGTVTQGTIGYAPAEVGLGFSFNGGTNRILVPDAPQLNFGSNQNFSIEAWISPLNPPPALTTGVMAIAEKRYSPNSSQALGYALDVINGQLYFQMSDSINNPMGWLSSGPDLRDGKMHHVAVSVTRNSTTGGLLFVDGVQVLQFDPTPVSGDLTTTQPFRIGNHPDPTYYSYFNGRMDELSVYKRALSASEIQAIYNAGSKGKFSTSSTLPYLDTDQDGIPDFWEKTFGTDPFTPNPDSMIDGSGYTELEEYLNWLAVPHALTVTNTPVSVDLKALCGKTGNLSFSVTNGVQGFVYLTNVLNYTNSLGIAIDVTNTGPFSNSIAVFTPTNNASAPTNYSGYASFDVFVTNNDTVAYFGPVTVSVMVSAVPVVYAAINTNSPPMLSTNLVGSTNINELTTLTVTNTATDANTNLTLTYAVTLTIDTNAMNLLGWTNSYANTTNTTPVITNGIITWTPSEAQGPGVYIITTTVTDNSIPPLSDTNSFSVTVEEVNTAPFWPTNVPSQTNYNIPALSTLVVTNTAMDSDLPPNPLTYQLSVSPTVANATISTNGIITWTPTVAQAPNLYTFTTIVTDTNAYALTNQSLSATNTFTVFVSSFAGPFAFTQPATAVTGTNAQLNGMATPNGLPATAWFEWGTNTLYGNQTPPVSVGVGYNVVYMTNQISGLLTNVPYHFRLVVSNALSVVHGFDQILDEAFVVAWGADYAGQLNVPSGLSNVVSIAAAYDHSLAVKNNETIAAWGDNTFSQANVPSGLSNMVAVAGGESYSLALKNSGTVFAWGANIFPGETNVPAGLSNAVTIASGQYSSLALRNDGTVAAWGANISGLTNVPPGVSNVVAVAGGSFHNLAIKNDGTVAVWGDDSSGQTNMPAGLTNIVAISGGSFHSLALKINGTVVAWGDDGAGQIDVPAGLSNVVAIAAGGFHSLALKSDGSVVAWGDNSAGQTSVPLGLSNVVAIAAGNLHSLALTPFSNINSTNIVLSITNGVAQTNNIPAGGITYYQVNVPTNADFATNILLFAQNGPLNVWFTTNSPPSIATNSTLLFVGSTNGSTSSVLSTTSAPTNIVPGSTYYLGVQNTNSVTVFYAIEVDFHLLTSPPVSISSIVYTNISGMNGFLLTWFAPSNDLFQVQWTASLLPTSWSTFTNIISYNTNVLANPTNTQFNFFDDGSQTAGFGSTRFYRLILLQATNTLTLPVQTNFTANISTTVIVTNTAIDSRPNAILTYNLTNAPAGAGISTNGIITWTNATPAGLAARFNTIVTDDSVPPLTASNTFTVFVSPLPSITNVTVTATNVVLKWSAPTNDQFQVQWTTNLTPIINWTLFPNIITSTNGLFLFTDTNAPMIMKFYQLILLP